ncbi:unnamed protein product [Chilo suppressalis]|uniref:MutL C-terminal dimerisation domain-containing protein n=1 Tax=Chilo suppressalis TaxID=168631 RepID=A0ABN8ATG0_CHISP|nr:unnamed protein product [Chilo suppressalis]
MSIKKLNEEIQSIIRSSSKITNFKTAVEELVYNSLDAESTSIAVRIDLLENKIQIVDNGCGITKKDFKLLGQKYATSKYSNLCQFRAAPNMYGFCGQVLSDIVNISKTVKIISRNSEETWCKIFEAGLECNLIKTNNNRASKGTTHPDNENYCDAKSYIPFYIIFLSCPYHDYDVNSTPKQSVLEFKNWDQVKVLLEKLIKFYKGDMNLKENKVPEKPIFVQQPITSSITEKVNEITKKILGNNSKKLGMSQMQNGIKGKLIKRRRKRSKKISIAKILPVHEVCSILNKNNDKISVPQFVENKIIKSKQNDRPKRKIAYKNVNNILKQAQKSKKYYIKDDNLKKVDSNDELSMKTPDPKIKKKNKLVDKPVKVKKAIKRRLDTPVSVEAQSDKVKIPRDITTKRTNHSFNIRNLKRIAPKKSDIVKTSKSILINNLFEDSGIAPPQKSQEHFKRPFMTSHDLLNTVLNKDKNPLILNTRDKKKFRTYFTINESLKNSLTTYESHHYENIRYKNINQTLSKNKFANQCIVDKPLFPLNNKNEKKRFISRHSKDNFNKPNSRQLSLISYENRFESSFQNHYCFKNTHMYLDDTNIINISDFSGKSNTNSNTKDSIRTSCYNITAHNETFMTKDKKEMEHIEQIHSTISSSLSCFTYTITSANMKINNGNHLQLEHNEDIKNITKGYWSGDLPVTLDKYDHMNNIKGSHENIVFGSESPKEPINLCEVILNSDDTIDFDSNKQLKSNTEQDTHINPNAYNKLENENVMLQQKPCKYLNTYVSIHHEVQFDNNIQIHSNLNKEGTTINCTREKTVEENIICDLIIESNYFNENSIESEKKQLNTSMFQLKNRFRFLPKGMSPIFENCNSKNICDYNLDEDYFETNLYNNFNNDVETNTELFEARVQNTKDVTTKDIEKFNFRMERDKSTLTFTKQSLKEAKVLGQVDNKFIITVIKGELDLGNYLLLFDQHAVHERITLEKNLTEYFNGNEWKSITLDNIILLKLTKDEIMYLHNYKEKFCRFGFQWTILNDYEINIHAIPLAILGQNPREVDKIIKTVKIFISEEIRNIMNQKGCVSMYPKSIMDLVNNEACRYSIMFGDTLSRKECEDLIGCLSTCKTPFQCAHGRPVMAVIMRFKSESEDRKYQINLNNVLRLQENFKTKYKC